MIPFLIYIALAVLVGYIGHRRKFGFWGNFLITLLLTPIVGAIAVLAQDVRYGDGAYSAESAEEKRAKEVQRCKDFLAENEAPAEAAS